MSKFKKKKKLQNAYKQMLKIVLEKADLLPKILVAIT